MARMESDREDLFAELQALRPRVELRDDARDDVIVIGVRPPSWTSLYLGQDRMVQFDDRGRVRRAYRHGLLYRTQGITLAQLTRCRTETGVELRRRDLSEAELSSFRITLREEIQEVREKFRQGQLTVLRSVENGPGASLADLMNRLEHVLLGDEWLAPALPTRPV